MSGHIYFTLGGLLPHHLSPQVKALYWSAILQNLALAMLLLFEPIYLWQQGFGVRGIILFFLGVYVAYFFSAPLGAAFATRFGFERSMILSTVIQIVYYVCLFLTGQSWWWAVPAFIFYAGQKSFYWPAYHADFARYADESEKGREIGSLSIILALVYIAGPFLAGLLLTFGSWLWLFAVGGIILLASNWALIRTPEIFTPRRFPYGEAIKRLTEPERRRSFWSFLGFGEELVVMVLWPVFIYIMVVNYATVGIMVAASTLLMALLTLYVGRLADFGRSVPILKFFTLIYSLSWVGRLAVNSPFNLFLVDAWSRISKNAVIVSLTNLVYEQARHRSFMDTAVFFEMSLSVGKILMALLLLVAFTFTTNWAVIWLLAALITMLYAFLQDR